MDRSEQRLAIRVDASVFEKKVKDHVAKGEVLGYYNGEPVNSPCNARVESVSFDSDDHALVVILVED